MNKKLIGLILTSFLLIGVVACSNNDNENVNENGNDNDENQEVTNEQGESNEDPLAGGQPDLDSILDTDNYPDVIAVVNGVELEKDTFVTTLGQQVMMMQAQGLDPESEEFAQQLDLLEQRTVDQFVNQETLNHFIAEAGIEATEAEIDDQLEEIMTQNQIQSEEQLLQVLEQQGSSLDELREDLAELVKSNKYIDQEIVIDSVKEEDLQAEYDQLVAQVEQSGQDLEIPSFEDAKEDIRKQLESEIQQEKLGELLVQLKEDRDITINL